MTTTVGNRLYLKRKNQFEFQHPGETYTFAEYTRQNQAALTPGQPHFQSASRYLSPPPRSPFQTLYSHHLRLPLPQQVIMAPLGTQPAGVQSVQPPPPPINPTLIQHLHLKTQYTLGKNEEWVAILRGNQHRWMTVDEILSNYPRGSTLSRHNLTQTLSKEALQPDGINWFNTFFERRHRAGRVGMGSLPYEYRAKFVAEPLPTAQPTALPPPVAQS
jgi:hypothetical protein